MLVAPIVYTILFYGGLVVGVIGLICVAIGGVATMNNKKKGALPDAVIANKRPRNGVLWQLLGAFALIGGPAASVWLWFHSNHVVFVRDDASHAQAPQIHREVWIGGAYVPARSLDDHPPRRTTWIVNESSRELAAQSVGYGDSHTWQPIAIPPGASLPVDSVDYVGPDDPPPGMIMVKHSKELTNAGISASAQRVWLTWE